MLDGALSLAAVLAAVLLARWFLFAVYVIPTGSMEPALHGRPDGGDRVFSFKPLLRFRPPRRWEMLVFDFPYRSATRRLAEEHGRPGVPPFNLAHELAKVERFRGTSYLGGLYQAPPTFIKRLVGLPGETVAIARGDLWVDAGQGFVRPERSDAVMRGSWIPVYAEDFARLDADTLQAWWTPESGDWRVENGALIGSGAGGPARAALRFRPRLRYGESRMADLPGVPDRYLPRQYLRFHCDPGTRHPYEPDDATGVPAAARKPGCGRRFEKTVDGTQPAAFCPSAACGAYLLENAVEFYQRRSGLGRGGELGYAARQAEEARRDSPYHLVGDLRFRAGVKIDAGAEAGLVFVLDANRRVEARWDDRRLEIRLPAAGRNPGGARGDAGDADAPALEVPLPPAPDADGWRRIEAYVADGRFRVFFDGAAAADLPLPGDAKPAASAAALETGLILAADGGVVSWRAAAVDRDIHYFSGLETPSRAYPGPPPRPQPLMGNDGAIRLEADEFLFYGDNAPDSIDARTFGPVARDLLHGPAVFMWWPPYRVRTLP